MLKIELPEKPVDQYRLDWYRVSVTNTRYYISKMHAIYHINTPWNVYSPNESGGTDLIDDWMLYHDENAQGRWCGWESPKSETLKNYLINCFATLPEANLETIRILQHYLIAETRIIDHIHRMIAEINEE